MSLEANETGNLIGSDKVEGTAVYGADRNKIGSIERVMIDKNERQGVLRRALVSAAFSASATTTIRCPGNR